MDISGLAAPASTSTANTDSALFTGTYDTFLKLLTAQIKAQNPLEPMEADKFTEQLVQYSGVEQQIKTNQNLETMLAALSTNAALGLVNYIGKTISAASDTTLLEDGKATWSYTLAADAPSTVVTIRNAAGAVVKTERIDAEAGTNLYVWDGKSDGGTEAPAGSYTITFDARDALGDAVAVTTRVTGRVTAIDTSKADPVLTVGDTRIPLSEVLSVGE